MNVVCERCWTSNPSGARFCCGCGRSLSASANATAPAASLIGDAWPQADAEMRQVTIMFCDLVDSVGLTERLPPETVARIILSYRNVCHEATTRYGGHFARSIGDGQLIYFGYPTTHEDAPRRAVQAGLAILQGMAALNGRLAHQGGPRLTVRIGIHTGQVLAGDLGTGGLLERMAVIGTPPNIAARIQQMAPPDTVLVSGDTHQLVGRYFVCRGLGARDLRGLSGSTEIVRVERERQHPLPAHRHDQQPLVGRNGPMATLLSHWQQARDGKLRAVLVTGEAGIGKSRLVKGLVAATRTIPHLRLVCRCSAYHTTSPFYPVTSMLRASLGVQPGDGVLQRRQRLEAALAARGVKPTPAILALMDAADDEVRDTMRQAPQRMRQALRQDLINWLKLEAARRPTLLIMEDVHWADDSTVSLIEALLSHAGKMPVLVVLTHRADTKPPPRHSALAVLSLDRLSGDDTARLVDQLTEGRKLPADLRDEIVLRTDGVPLFVEELTRSLIESAREDGTDTVRRGATRLIPMTLRDHLTERLDRLPDAKPVAQMAATLGRTFSEAVLSEVIGDPVQTTHALQRLVEGDILRQHSTEAEDTHSFRHALIQEAAYASLPSERQRECHRRVAAVLRGSFCDTTPPEIIAFHLAAAGETEPAISYWTRAGRRAGERSAAVEAAAHFGNALALTETLPVGHERARLELDLQVALGTQLLAAQGNAAPGVARAYQRAIDLAEQAGDPPLLFRALYGIHTFHTVRGDLQSAEAVGRRQIAHVAKRSDPSLVVHAHRLYGLGLLYRGEFHGARDELRIALAAHDPELHRAHRFEYGSDPGVLSRCNLAWAEWFMGDPGRAEELAIEAIGMAEELRHPHSLAFALSFAGSLHQFGNLPGPAHGTAMRVIELARSNAFPYWAAWGEAIDGWALGHAGDALAGLAKLRRALDAYEATGARLMHPYLLTLVGELELRADRVDAALAALTDAMDHTQAGGAAFYEAETLRLRAVALSRLGNQYAADQSAEAALARAMTQQSPTLQARCRANVRATKQSNPEPG